MKLAGRFLILGALFVTGCEAMHDAAVSTFRVLDAPANFVRRKIANEPAPNTTTTTTTSSDAINPGHPVSPNPTPTRQANSRSGKSRSSRDETRPIESPKPSVSPAVARNQPSQFPTAKPVPGKPGFVFSPFDTKGGYVDVSGYAPGSKVKDPYSGKIFLVP